VLIRNKLLIPVGVQFTSLTLILGSIFWGVHAARTSLEQRAALGRAVMEADKVQQLTTEYFSSPVPQETVESSLGKHIVALKDALGADQAARLDALQAELRRVGAEKRRNLAIEKEVLALTNLSKTQSDGYIEKTVAKLTHPTTRDRVTDLERMVIVGANVNTSSQWAIQKLFYRMMYDLSAKDELLAFLAKAQDNTAVDIERLRNTPFQGMAVAAQEANKKIGTLVKEYIANSERIAAAQAATRQQWQTLATQLETQTQQSQVHSVRQVTTGFGIVGLVSALAGVATALLVILLGRQISGALRRTVEMLREICEGEGDLTRRLSVSSSDEIGELAHWFNVFAGKLQHIISQIADGTRILSGSAAALSDTATQLASGAEQTTGQSAQVAAAAEQMSTNMNSMAQATEQMSTNVRVVASAVEELTASISEVAKSAEQAASVAENAARLAADSNARISELGGAADQIGKVIEVIEDIAEQTNLLALNATIEAARAGEAGKGFAVVATEVKELARQTAGATEDIRKRIEGIQGSTGLAVQSIGDIGKVIGQVNQLSRTIAAAVDEQSITTKEIARNVSQSSTVAQTVARGVAESASASQEITRNIVGVDQAAKQTAHGAAQAQTAGRDLSGLAEQLQSLVGQFKTGDAAALAAVS
jgi:methyl-accepting chemotaxis protein